MIHRSGSSASCQEAGERGSHAPCFDGLRTGRSWTIPGSILSVLVSDPRPASSGFGQDRVGSEGSDSKKFTVERKIASKSHFG
ncbi:MAG: hypothetical protein CSA62_14145 [Planctomycetota bacterium]|nr:MAG: hypothetical protein CSA62_14145 [Planctomycetota bacterium]